MRKKLTDEDFSRLVSRGFLRFDPDEIDPLDDPDNTKHDLVINSFLVALALIILAIPIGIAEGLFGI